MISRRGLFMGTAVGGTAALVTGTAGAFSVETIPDQSGLGVALAQRCIVDPEHAAFRASLQAQLAGLHAPPGTSMSEPCPICGCPIIAMAK